MWPKREIKNLPQPPTLWSALGVGVVVLSLAIGTGELILWPYLVSQFGLGIMWGALLGFTFQYILNQEIGRLTLATGESFFTASARLVFWLPIVWLVFAILLYVWPGWAGALGTIMVALTGVGDFKLWAWFCLILVLFITLVGRSAYQVLELAVKILAPIFIILLVIVSFYNLDFNNFLDLGRGMINFGWWPVGLKPEVFLAAIVFSGTGGLLNVGISLWYRDKALGMGKYAGRITNPLNGKEEAVAVSGFTFLDTDIENMIRWKKWWRYLVFDQGVLFWGLGLFSVSLLALNAEAILGTTGSVPEGIEVVVMQANIFGEVWGSLGSKVFLVMVLVMLFSTMWTILDAFTRIMSDIIYTNARAGQLKFMFKIFKNISIHRLYYGLFVSIVIINMILIPFNQPFQFLILSSVLGGIAMAIYTPLLIWHNNTKLPKLIRPSLITNFLMICAWLFYAGFSLWLILDLINLV